MAVEPQTYEAQSNEGVASKPAHPLPLVGKEGESTLTQTNLPSALEEDTNSLFQGCFLYRHPQKDGPEQKLSMSLLRHVQK